MNPSLVSNLVFYNYGKEKVRNPHRPVEENYKVTGYNLNDYVITQPMGREGNSSKYSKNRNLKNNGRKVMRSQRSSS